MVITKRYKSNFRPGNVALARPGTPHINTCKLQAKPCLEYEIK